MIVIRTEKELISSVENWSEIEERPGFTRDLDPRTDELRAIIGRYAFKDEIRCGLSTCHQLHQKGYIVATQRGLETNIGKDCGKRYFGVDFQTLSRQFDREVAAKEHRDALWSFYFGLEEVKHQVDALNNAESGARWVHARTRPLVEPSRGVPQSVIQRLQQLTRSGDGRLTKARRATDAEVDLLRQTQPNQRAGPQYIEETLAVIRGLEALASENDLRQLLVVDIEQNIEVFQDVSIDELTFEELRHWSKWIGGVAQKLDRARGIIESGKRLLTRANLAPLLEVLDDRKETAEFRDYLGTLPAGQAHTTSSSAPAP